MRVAFQPELEHVEGTRDYFSGELRSLGKLTAPEKGVCSSFWRRRSWHSPGVLRVPAAGLNPAYGFLTFAVLCFVIRHKGEPAEVGIRSGSHVLGVVLSLCRRAALGESSARPGREIGRDMLVPFAGSGGGSAPFSCSR